MTQFKWCYRHHAEDTNGDGDCVVFSVANKSIKKLIGECSFAYVNPVHPGGAFDPDEIRAMVESGHKSSYSRAMDLADWIEGDLRVIGRMGVGPVGDVIDAAVFLEGKFGSCMVDESDWTKATCKTHGLEFVEPDHCGVGRFKEWVLNLWDEGEVPEQLSENLG